MGKEKTALARWGEVICDREVGSRLSLRKHVNLEEEAMKELKKGCREMVEREGFQVVEEVAPRQGYAVVRASEDKKTEENRGKLQFMLNQLVYFEGEELPY